MDPNLLYWKNHGQSFLRRVAIWFNLLDPTVLFASKAEIEKAHNLLGSGRIIEKDEPALTLALSSVHADSGNVLPLAFRPPALLPLSAPLVLGSFLPHTTVKSSLFWQFALHSYMVGFNHVNRNSSSEQGKTINLKKQILAIGTVSFATCAGALPQILINRLRIKSAPVQALYRSVLPVPLSAALAAVSVFTIRSEESETGILVFDSNGNSVGLSKAAGEKAVRETAWTRAALFGTTSAVPNLLLFLLKGNRLFQKKSLLDAFLRNTSVALALGLMIPLSFSLFPQLGTITKESLEKELQHKAVEGQLYYHRGV